MALAKSLGLGALHLSLSWARLQPEGRGPLRAEALSAYRRVLERVADAGIRAHVSLCSHDLPDALGSWERDGVVRRFGDYAEQAAARFGDVASFLTIDEPATDALPARDPVAVAGALASAHALALQAIRSTCAGPVGLAIEVVTAWPGDGGGAARFFEAASTHAWLRLARGGPPELAAPGTGAALARSRLLSAVGVVASERVDFVVLRPTPPCEVADGTGPLALAVRDADPKAWEPWVPLVAAHEALGRDEAPVLLAASRCEVPADADEEREVEGRVQDVTRVARLHRDAAAWRTALTAGVPLAGWFAADLLDGHDVARGARVRTGVVRVEPETGRRTVKDSGRELGRIAADWT